MRAIGSIRRPSAFRSPRGLRQCARWLLTKYLIAAIRAGEYVYAAIPDNAPAAIQAIWAQMNQLVESRGAEPGLAIAGVSSVSR